MSDIDTKIICKTIDINNIVSIKLIVYGLFSTWIQGHIGGSKTQFAQNDAV